MNRIISLLTTSLRWRIARLLDKIPDVCWAEAATWAQWDHDFTGVFGLRHTAGRCAAGGDAPYCGKCAVAKGALVK